MWMYSIRTTQAFDPSSGGELASPTHEVLATIPPGFYTEQLIFNLSNESIAKAPAAFVNTGNSFSLTAMDSEGNFIHQLSGNITLQVTFNMTEIQGIDSDTLSIYTWNTDTNTWVALSTAIDFNSLTATAQVDHLSIFTLLGRSDNLIFLPLVIK